MLLVSESSDHILSMLGFLVVCEQAVVTLEFLAVCEQTVVMLEH